MPSQSDIDALLSAMARGVLTVRSADGSQVTYRSIAEMAQALSVLRSEMAGSSGTERTSYAEFDRS